MTTILSPSISTTTLPTNRRGAQIEYIDQQVGESPELNRLICAAVVSRKFRKQLLRTPELALEAGYNGEQFQLTAAEREFVLSCRGGTLNEFAARLATSA